MIQPLFQEQDDHQCGDDDDNLILNSIVAEHVWVNAL